MILYAKSTICQKTEDLELLKIATVTQYQNNENLGVLLRGVF